MERERTTIFGYGSLMSIESCRLTCPGLTNYRQGRLLGYRRLFNLVGMPLIERGLVDPDARELAFCSVVPEPAARVHGVLFDVDARDRDRFLARADRLKVRPLVCHALAGGAEVEALVCTAYTDAQYLAERFGGDRARYDQEVGAHYRGSLWHRHDILPATAYLELCLQEARALGPACLENLLDASLLADRTTSVRAYIEGRPALFRSDSAAQLDPDTLADL